MQQKILLTLLSLCSSLLLAAQNSAAVEMADAFRADGKIYVVVAVALIVFLGMIVFLFTIDRRLRQVEKDIRN